ESMGACHPRCRIADKDQHLARKDEPHQMKTKYSRARNVLIAFVFLSLVAGSFVGAGEKRKAGPLPWHLVDIWVVLDKAEDLESIEVDLDFSQEIPEIPTIFVAPIYGWINEE